MRRELPPRPHLDHLKSQAKDLLDAHRRGDPEAFARIRAAVPAFAHKSDDAIAKGPFALHDAQSAIAREYGFASWAELRAKVSGVSSAYPAGPILALSGQNVPPALQAAIHEALLQRGSGSGEPTPDTVPVLALRNAMLFPGAMAPLDVARPTTLRAIEAALGTQPAFLAVFAQRQFETESPRSEDLHPTGCLCIVRFFHRAADGGQAWILVEGIRWVTLEVLGQVDPHYVARVASAGVDRGDESEIALLDRRLRETARKVVDMMPDIREQALALIDGTEDSGQLADLVMANFQGEVAVADMAAYADDKQLPRRLERVIALLDAELAKAAATPA
jgi:Lon protease-like protein